MDDEESTRAFSARVSDCRERLFDELAAGDFPTGKQMRKLYDGHHCALVPSVLRNCSPKTPKRRTGKRKGTTAGRAVQKLSTIFIHVRIRFVKISFCAGV
jgi:hypothetical protein